MSVSEITYSPQEIRRQVVTVQGLLQPDGDIGQRDDAINELSSNLLFLHNEITTNDLGLMSSFFDEVKENMVALLESLDKMVSIFKENRFPYYSDAGWQGARAPVNYKEYLVMIVQDFMKKALDAGYTGLEDLVRQFLAPEGSGPLQTIASSGRGGSATSTVIKNKTEILELLHLAA